MDEKYILLIQVLILYKLLILFDKTTLNKFEKALFFLFS